MPELTAEQAKVMETIVDRADDGASLAEIVRRTGLAEADAKRAVIDLVHDHDAVTELDDDPDGTGGGPMYVVKTRGGG
jgi:uncharacterized membrane protein YqiK